MKQSTRIKKLQLFLYDTGRMKAGYPWNVNARGYPGEYYIKTTMKGNARIKWWWRKVHLECQNCGGQGQVYVGRSEYCPSGYEDCTKCNGRMWSKKSYRR